jgi:hypothetical protein
MRILLAAGVVVLAVGCGSSNASKTQTTDPVAAATAWAGGVCLAFTNYKTDLQSAGASLRANPSKNQLYESVSAAQTASTDLQNTLAGVGPAPAEAKPAQQALSSLKAQVKSEVDAIQSLIGGVSTVADAKTAAPKIRAELDKIQADLKQAGTALKGVPSGALQQGFQQAPNCQSLGG